MSASVPTLELDGPHALRVFARAFSQFENFDRFAAALEGALPRVTGLTGGRIVLDRHLTEVAERFEPGLLSLPLTGEGGPVGLLQVGRGEERRFFGAGDLQLLAGLADFVGAALMQAQRAQDAARSRELLRFLLNQAPVGIAAYGPDRRPVVANELALRWLGDSPLPFAEIEAGAEQFFLRSGGKLISGEVRRVGESPAGTWVVAMHDLTPEQARLMDGLRRELYRARAEGATCAVALIEAGEPMQGALHRLPALRGMLRAGELAGPYDATRVALVLGSGGLELRARLRGLQPALAGLGPVRAGYAELGRDGVAPEPLLDRALESVGEFEPVTRRALLIHDENPAVAATLALVLGREFRVMRSESPAESAALLARGDFEGVVCEWDPSRGAPPTVVAEARARQPRLRTFYTSVDPALRLPAGEDAVVIEKPFDVAALTARVRAALAD